MIHRVMGRISPIVFHLETVRMTHRTATSGDVFKPIRIPGGERIGTNHNRSYHGQETGRSMSNDRTLVATLDGTRPSNNARHGFRMQGNSVDFYRRGVRSIR